MKPRILRNFRTLGIPALAVFSTTVLYVQAQTTWDGGGQSDGSWANADNWDNNTLPVFDGTDSLTLTRNAAYISAGGTLYTDPITVAITGDGTGATATATRNGTAISSITITNGGSGYTTVPAVAITGTTGTDAVAQISLTSTGSVATAGVTSLTLGADRSISRLTFGGGATAISLSGNTLRLNSTTTTAAAGTALWNANTNDNITATVNSNLLLQSGSAGSYTGHFRENINSSGGTRFNGTITQGAGENWTLRFSRFAARGQFFLNNVANSISAIRNDGADVYSEVAGAFGGAALTLGGGFTGTRLTDHYTTAVSNNITVSAASTWESRVQTRLTGSLTQAAQTLSYGSNVSPSGSSLTRLEYSAVSGTGTTNLQAGGLSVSSMSQFASGTLNLGNGTSSSAAALILSGTSGNNVPTWADFSTARTFNQSGGAGTWRININAGLSDNVFNAGGFAARGADLVIPATGGGLTSATFTRNFTLGSAATLDGSRYANHAVKIETAIDYGVLASSANRYFGAAWNVGAGKTLTNLTLAGPVHELAGAITGTNVIVYPIGHQDQAAPLNGTSEFGIIRISNSSNALADTSRWIIGGQRGAFTSMGGGAIPAAANMGDKSNVTLVFTSDAAFGGAAEVQVSAQPSSGSRPTGTLLFEDVNGGGSTTFNRAVNLMTVGADVGGAAIGSYGGDVIYTGTSTFGSGVSTTANSFMMHAEPGSTFTLDSTATFTNNSGGATTFNKTGGGTMNLSALSVGGTQTANSWNVRAGTLNVNTTLAAPVTVSTGATLGGNGTVGALTTGTGGNAVIAPGTSVGLLSCSSTLNADKGAVFKLELGSNATPGTTHDQIAVTGVFTGSATVAGLKFEFTGLGGLTAGVPYTLLTYVSSTALTYADLSATVLPAGFILDTTFGTGGWLINGTSLQVQFSSTGGASPYDDWADDFPGFTPTDAALDFDNDGIENLLEFVLGGNPTTNDTPSVLPTVSASGSDLIVTFKRSDASELQPVTVKVQVSDDLSTWNPADDILIGPGPSGTGPNSVTYTVDDSGTLDSIVVTIPKGAALRKFARVVVND